MSSKARLPLTATHGCSRCNRVQMYQQQQCALGKCLRGCLYFVVFENVFYRQLDDEVQEIIAAEDAKAEQEEVDRKKAEAEAEPSVEDGEVSPKANLMRGSVADEEAKARDRYWRAWSKVSAARGTTCEHPMKCASAGIPDVPGR